MDGEGGVAAGAPAQVRPVGRGAAGWGAPVVSLVVLATFAGVLGVVLTQALPEKNEQLLNVLLGTLAAMATGVVSYWVGSSAGSARKDDLLARQRGVGE